jgi:hypothetical protein
MRAALAVVVAAVVALAERLAAVGWYRGWFAQGMVGDMSVHYTIVAALKEDPRTRRIDQYLIGDQDMTYPTAYHRYAGLFGLAALRRRPWLPNLVLAVVAAAAFVLYADRLAPAGTAGDHFVVVAAVVFLLSSANLVFRGPGIAYLSLSERYLGRISCAAAYAFMVGAKVFAAPAGWWLAAGAAALAVGCSVFARQALVFSAPVLALVWLDARPVLVVAAGFLLALVVSRRRLVEGLRDTVIQWRYYPRLTKRGRLQPSTLSGYVRPGALWAARARPKDLAEELTRREPSRSLLLYPELTLMAVLLVASAVDGHVGRLVLGPLVAAGAVYGLTSTDRFNHLGEAYRYLEFELYFSLPLLAARQALFLTWGWVVVLLIAYVVAVAAAVYLWVVVVTRYTFPTRPDEMSAFLADVDTPDGTVVFPVPMLIAPDVCVRRPGCRSFWWQPGAPPSPAVYDKYFEEFPFLKRHFDALFDEYKVSLVLVDKSQSHFVDWSYDFSRLAAVKEGERYAAYRVPRSPGLR